MVAADRSVHIVVGVGVALDSSPLLLGVVVEQLRGSLRSRWMEHGSLHGRRTLFEIVLKKEENQILILCVLCSTYINKDSNTSHQ